MLASLPLIAEPQISRRFTDASTTLGFRTPKASLIYCDLAAVSFAVLINRTGALGSFRCIVDMSDNNGSHGMALEILAAATIELNVIGSSNMRQASTSTVPTNAWTHVICRNSNVGAMVATNVDFMFNGVQENGPAGTNGSGHATGTAQFLTIGNTNNATWELAPPLLIAYVAIWNYKISDVMGQALARGASPLQFMNGLVSYWKMNAAYGRTIEPDRSGNGLPVIAFSSSTAPLFGNGPTLGVIDEDETVDRFLQDTGGGSFTLVADNGTFTLNGQNANLLAGHKLVAAQGAYTLSGKAANLLAGRKLVAAQGTYALAGQAASLLAARKLAAAQGTYTLTGEPATLNKGRVLVADSGTFTLAGQSSNLLTHRVLSAVDGVYNLSGKAAILRRGYLLAAGPGSYALTGEAAGSVYNRVLNAGAGIYRLNGIPATLIYSGATAQRSASGLPDLQVGFLNSNIEVQRATRDIAKKINDMLHAGAFEFDPIPAGDMQVLAQGHDGQWHLWELKAGTGCSIVFDGARYTVTLNVP